MLPLKSKQLAWKIRMMFSIISYTVTYPQRHENIGKFTPHYSNRVTVPHTTLACIALSFDKIAHMNFTFLLWHSLAIITLFQPMLKVWIRETLRVNISESSDIASRRKNEAATSSHLHHGFICASECAVPAS